MTPRRPANLSIGLLLGRGEAALAGELCERLTASGHDVELASSGEALLALAPFDVVASDADLPGQWSGLGLAEALVSAGHPTRFVLLGELREPSHFRRALRLGVRDHLPRPFELDELADALLAAAEPAPSRETFARAYALGPGTAEVAARELAAFLLVAGIPPSHRVRAATAVAGLVQVLGARGGASRARLFLGARLGGETLGVDLEARGLAGAGVELVPPLLPGRDARPGELLVRRLCDGLRIRSQPHGPLVRLSFHLAPVRFEEEDERLAELDFLDLESSRAWLEGLRGREHAIPPALTTTVGRLLAADGTESGALAAARDGESR